MRVRTKSGASVAVTGKSALTQAKGATKHGATRLKSLMASENEDGSVTIMSDEPGASISLVVGTDSDGNSAVVASEVL